MQRCFCFVFSSLNRWARKLFFYFFFLVSFFYFFFKFRFSLYSLVPKITHRLLPERGRDARGGGPRDDLSPVREHDDDADGAFRGPLALRSPLLLLLLLPSLPLFPPLVLLLLLLRPRRETRPPESPGSEQARRRSDPGRATPRWGRRDGSQELASREGRRRRRGRRRRGEARRRGAAEKDAAVRCERPAALGPQSGGDELLPRLSVALSFGCSQRLSHLLPRASDGERRRKESARLSPRFRGLFGVVLLLARGPPRVLALGARLLLPPHALRDLSLGPVVRIKRREAGVVGADRGRPAPLALAGDGDALAAEEGGPGGASALFPPCLLRLFASAPAPASVFPPASAPPDAAALARHQGPPDGQGPPGGDDERPVR